MTGPTRTLLALLAMLWLAPAALAAVPDFVTYSGRLTDGMGWGKSATVALTLRVYGSASGNDLLWEKEYSPLAVEDGYFTVLLGNGLGPDGKPLNVTTLFAAHDQTWITMCVDSGCTPLDDLLPRQQIGSVPYAVESQYVGGKDANALVWNRPWDKDIVPQQGGLCLSGEARVGALVVSNPFTMFQSVPTGDKVVANFQGVDGGGSCSGLTGDQMNGFITLRGAGAGVALGAVRTQCDNGEDFVVKQETTDGTMAETFRIKENGAVVVPGAASFEGKVGIGTSTSPSRLAVDGNLGISAGYRIIANDVDPVYQNSIEPYNSTTGNMEFRISSASPENGNYTFAATHGKGNVGIGTTDPKARLEVDGDIGVDFGATALVRIGTRGGDGNPKSCDTICNAANGACLGAWDNNNIHTSCSASNQTWPRCLCALVEK
jgi:hypothetical protein